MQRSELILEAGAKLSIALLHSTVNMEGANQRRGLAGVEWGSSHLGKSLMQAVVHVAPNGLLCGRVQMQHEFQMPNSGPCRSHQIRVPEVKQQSSFIKPVIDSRIYIRCGQVRR
ncbi:hypothetical protein GCT13_02220 [Paraburkholderia sp. CNPSo 3157]|uniref:Uncharacterized protein n=1 Tax=Paraburkholderia franconis TaxID=2654983 RepID=A0A7X1N5J5_9BURK|nr:hypothetical protein [Paraburkholderia franconis]MPW15759.1 hypothetical protein [Paraburkholderia franconis]